MTNVMSREEREARKPGAGRPRREFTSDEIRRMDEALQEEDATAAEVARRFSVSVSTLYRAIRKKAS